MVALCNKIAAFGYYIGAVAAALAASDVRYDAIGAEVVTAIHYGYPRLVRGHADAWHTFYDVTLIASEDK